MRVLDLFSGIGGFSLGLERAGMTTVAFCEQDKFCQQVLKKHWPNIPIFDDVRTLDGKPFRGTIDVVCGGFPCQPFSVAGKQKGKSDERHLWPEMLRIIRECQPTWVIGENVSGFVNMALDDCWSDLEAEGYEVQPFIIPACGVEGYHRRDRCWIVAHAQYDGRVTEPFSGSVEEAAGQQPPRSHNTLNTARTSLPPPTQSTVADSRGKGLQGHAGDGDSGDEPGRLGTSEARSACTRSVLPGGWREVVFAADCDEETDLCPCGFDYAEECAAPGPTLDDYEYEEVEGTLYGRPSESRLGRGIDGLPSWLDGFEYIGDPDRFGTPRVTARKDNRANRLKALGNAVVPQIPEIIGRAIMSLPRHDKRVL